MIRRPAVHAAFVASALIAALQPLPARAQSKAGEAGEKPDVSEKERAVARRHFLRGKELHAAGKYREAAEEYLAAYERFPAPAFLYNVAQVYRLAGDKKTALEHYRKYLELEPEGEGSADAREFVAALEAALAAESEAAAQAKPQQVPQQPPQRTDPIEPPAQRTPITDAGVDSNPGRGKKITGAAVGAAGVVGLGVAFAFALKARSATDELNAFEGEWTPDQQATYDDGKSAERIAGLSAALGGGALVTGAVLYYLGNRQSRSAAESREQSVEVSAAGTPDSALLLVRGAF
jgi:tetratricopeptide (TPR) repeat protein